MAEYFPGEDRPEPDVEFEYEDAPEVTEGTTPVDPEVVPAINPDDRYVPADLASVEAKEGDPGYYMGDYAIQHITTNPEPDEGETDPHSSK